MTHRLLPKPVAGAVDTSADDATELKWEFDEDLGRYYVSFQLSSSGAQLGSIGDLCRIWGSSFILVP